MCLILCVTVSLSAQKTTWFQWTFLPQETMDEIIGEASGETAYNHVIEMGGYNKDRLESEYKDTFYEARYVLDMMKHYGLEGAKIERFPGGKTWDGIAGELWEVEPKRQKLASFTDIRAMLATGSNPADVTAELVWIGDGSDVYLKNVDVSGKIVVTSAPVGAVHNTACLKMGAEGIISFYSPRPLFDPLIIPWYGFHFRDPQEVKFAFYIPPREGHFLRDRLLGKEKIVVHAKVESEMRSYELQVPTCFIPGTDPESGEIIFSAHIFEGYAKQGANDNKSGCAAILDVARTLKVLIDEGRIPQPKRTIRFIWVPEYTGTIPWAFTNRDIVDKTLCNINLDMVGIKLTENLAYMTMMRTTYGNPHYVNDVMENYYHYMGETNREYVANGFSSSHTRRIVAPSGSEEPFYYYIGTHFGGSDHEVFNDWAFQVPGIVMNTWPDKWYHTSEDRSTKIDPTQLKRTIIICSAAAYTIANAGDETALHIASEIVSNAAGRIGHQLARGIAELKLAGSDNFNSSYRKARGYIEAASINERATLSTLLELAENKESMNDYIKKMQRSISNIEETNLETLEAHMIATAEILGIKPAKIVLSDEEKRAAKIFPVATPKVKENGFRGYQQFIQKAVKEAGDKYPTKGLKTGAEIQLLCTGEYSALDIKKMVDTQYRSETSLQTILNYLEILKIAGLIEMNE